MTFTPPADAEIIEPINPTEGFRRVSRKHWDPTTGKARVRKRRPRRHPLFGPATGMFGGEVEDVWVLNRALTPEQIRTIYSHPGVDGIRVGPIRQDIDEETGP